jgi:PBP1b-binding outer membrane lipoprotein LpoB
MKKTIIITLLTFLLFSCSQEKMKEETIQKQNNEIEIQESNMQEIKENKDREQKITQKDYE